MIDCYDGLPVFWTIGTSPNADLVNTILDIAFVTLRKEEHPLVHSDCGSHYRWSGWIERIEKVALIRFISKKGCSLDNYACEVFWDISRMRCSMIAHGQECELMNLLRYLINIYIGTKKRE